MTLKSSLHKRIISIVVLLVILVGNIIAQRPEVIEERGFNDLDFDFTYFVTPIDTSLNARLNVLTVVSFNRLQFVKKGNMFKSYFEKTITLSKDDKIIVEKSWMDSVETTSFRETDSPEKIYRSRLYFDVPSDQYELNIYLKDLNTGHRINHSTEIKIDSYDSDKYKSSDVFFINRLNVLEGEIIGYVPGIYSAFENSGAQYLAYLEVIPAYPGEKIQIKAEIKSIKRRKKFSIKLDQQEFVADGEKIPIVFNIESNQFPSGLYKLECEIVSDNKKSKKSVEFLLDWFGSPVLEFDLDVALKQMKYALPEIMELDLDELSYDQKVEIFTIAWLKRDPDPQTPYNKLKEEYFRRVRYANRNFTVFRDGWKTDRGKVYILFGPPSEVIRQDYRIDSLPMQFWRYFRTNMVFAFYDRNGFGDFILTRPLDNSSWKRTIK